MLESGKAMIDQRQWYAGVDWASESHHVVLTDRDGRKIGERVFKHGGEGLAEMAAWLMATSGALEGSQIQVAIEVPHGPVVETLIERGFKVHAINPKQMDRFRDRFTLAGAKDDSRDAEVMASSLRTDPRCFRLLAVADPVVIELREWSRIAEDLGAERNRLTNRLREQLWRYFPAVLELENDLGAEWLLDLWERPCRRPTRPCASARRRSSRFSSAIASAASTPPMCSTCCASRPCGSLPVRPKPPAPTSPRSLRASAS
jgi:transposase